MRYLIDTHTLLWFVNDDPQLPISMRELMENEETDLFISVGSIWEMAIKFSIGKLKLPSSFDAYVRRHIDDNYILVLQIDVSHLTYVTTMPFHHRDPFDRLIIAQSLVEHLPIISADEIFDGYGVSRVW